MAVSDVLAAVILPAVAAPIYFVTLYQKIATFKCMDKWHTLQPVWFGRSMNETPQAEACATENKPRDGIPRKL
jgi:hypothetical protein